MRFHRYLAAVLLAAIPPLGLGAPTPARASADIDCDPDLKIAHASFTRCNVMTAIGPGNDKRANLLLLLLDRDGTPPLSPPAPPLPDDAVPLFFWKDFRDLFVAPAPPPASGFATGEGSRCLSNPAGMTAFAAAVAAANMPNEDRSALIDARKALTPLCSVDPGARLVALNTSDTSHSTTWRAYGTYLRGVDAFYAGQFDEAAAAFATLHGNADAWLANAADYMVARTLVDQLQAGAVFDDYGALDEKSHVDQGVADRATAALESYLRDHPGGSYAASARGLERRVDWLAGRKAALASGYAALLAQPAAKRGIEDATLAEEISDKLLPSLTPTMTHDPILIATVDLAAMRAQDPIGSAKTVAAPPPVDLEAQRTDFANAMPLYDFLAATQALYIEHDPAKVMKLVPDDTHRHGGNHLWFARQVLRGLALEAKGDRNARGFWKELFAAAERPVDQLTVQLGLAMHDERAHSLEDVFAPNSIVTNERLRAILIETSANASLLRREARAAATPAHERDLALSTLLWKEVTRGHYADFVDDVALVPADGADDKATSHQFTRPQPGEIDCPSLATTAGQLAQDPIAVRGRLCLAEFVRVLGQSYDSAGVTSASTADQLGGAPSMFPGKPYDRASTYKAIIADKGAPAADRAFALYRAILCWAPSGVNDCGGPDVPKAQRAAWFKMLKRDYPTSRWAKGLIYWW